MFTKKLTCQTLPRKFYRVVLPLLVIALILITFFGGKLKIYWRDVGYLTRPLWDTPPPSMQLVPMYRHVKTMSDEQWCGLHGWTARPQNPKPNRVIDAVIFSIELDLLEIRIRELWDEVDMFVIAESDHTFNGDPKPRTFADNQDRFRFADSKIHYVFHPGRNLEPDESPFTIEFEMRQSITKFLKENAAAGDLVIMSDVDEIPRQETIRLLNTCDGWGNAIQLQLHEFIYSFEFSIGFGSWISSVHRYEPEYTIYDHGHFSNTLLTDAGWHCSFCFPRIEDFKFKMLAYSHSDRVTDQHFLDDEYIREKVCSGENIFGMLPEAYTFKELLLKLGPMKKSTSFNDIPGYVLLGNQRMEYLLPGGCARY